MKLTKKSVLGGFILMLSVVIIFILANINNRNYATDIVIDQTKLSQQKNAPFSLGILPLKVIDTNQQILLVNLNTNEFYLLKKSNYSLIKKYPIPITANGYEIVDAGYHENRVYLLLNKFSVENIAIATKLISLDAQDKSNINNPKIFDIVNESAHQSVQPHTVNFLSPEFKTNQIMHIIPTDGDSMDVTNQIVINEFTYPLTHIDQIEFVFNKLIAGTYTTDDIKYVGVIKDMQVFYQEMYLWSDSEDLKKITFNILNSSSLTNVIVESNINYGNQLFNSTHPIINNSNSLILLRSKDLFDKILLQKVDAKGNVKDPIQVEKNKFLGSANIDNNLVYFLLNSDGKVSVNSI